MAKKTSGPKINKKLQTHNSFATLQEEGIQEATVEGQITPQPNTKAPLAQPVEEPNKEILMEEKKNTEEETEAKDMILRELDLDGMEMAFATNRPKDITPQ